MAKVLHEYFGNVQASDAYDYGYAPVRDYLATPYEAKAVDWVITNPPFRLAEQFVLRSLDVSRHGVAMLVRTVFLESVGRYNRLFSQCPPSIFARFVERVPMVKGRLDQKATTATGYAWLVWDHRTTEETKVVWIPPCRRLLERKMDYPSRQPSLI